MSSGYPRAVWGTALVKRHQNIPEQEPRAGGMAMTDYNIMTQQGYAGGGSEYLDPAEAPQSPSCIELAERAMKRFKEVRPKFGLMQNWVRAPPGTSVPPKGNLPCITDFPAGSSDDDCIVISWKKKSPSLDRSRDSQFFLLPRTLSPSTTSTNRLRALPDTSPRIHAEGPIYAAGEHDGPNQNTRSMDTNEEITSETLQRMLYSTPRRHTGDNLMNHKLPSRKEATPVASSAPAVDGVRMVSELFEPEMLTATGTLSKSSTAHFSLGLRDAYGRQIVGEGNAQEPFPAASNASSPPTVYSPLIAIDPFGSIETRTPTHPSTSVRAEYVWHGRQIVDEKLNTTLFPHKGEHLPLPSVNLPPLVRMAYQRIQNYSNHPFPNKGCTEKEPHIGTPMGGSSSDGPMPIKQKRVTSPENTAANPIHDPQLRSILKVKVKRGPRFRARTRERRPTKRVSWGSCEVRIMTPRPSSSPPPVRRSKRAKTPRGVRSQQGEEEQDERDVGIDELFGLEILEEEESGSALMEEAEVNQEGEEEYILEDSALEEVEDLDETQNKEYVQHKWGEETWFYGAQELSKELFEELQEEL
ncbi:hypothetical protein BGX38DRAFT_1142025 [Terfezia claveryi]|nr:hypothetical protein BGX38DRAFT_1142025 [Terfezia claveryi]